jgi:hypothetical protein
MSVYE